MQPISDEERQKVELIYAETFGKVNLGFDPSVLEILDDAESSEKEREEIKGKVSQEIVARLIHLAESAYLGNISQGKAESFAAVIMRLGAIYVKIFIIGFALLALAKDERSKMVLAKSFSAAIIGKLFAEQLNWQKESAQRVEICCLFSEVGKVLIHLYEKKTDESVPDDFVERCHWLLALKIAEEFKLPEYIRDSFTYVFGENSLRFTHNSLSVAGVVMLAYATVSHIFSRERCLIINSPMPEAKDVFAYTPGKIIYNYLWSLGLSDDYLKINAEKSKMVK